MQLNINLSQQSSSIGCQFAIKQENRTSVKEISHRPFHCPFCTYTQNKSLEFVLFFISQKKTPALYDIGVTDRLANKVEQRELLINIHCILLVSRFARHLGGPALSAFTSPDLCLQRIDGHEIANQEPARHLSRDADVPRELGQRQLLEDLLLGNRGVWECQSLGVALVFLVNDGQKMAAKSHSPSRVKDLAHHLTPVYAFTWDEEHPSAWPYTNNQQLDDFPTDFVFSHEYILLIDSSVI